MIPEALLKTILPTVKKQLGKVNEFIVAELAKQEVDVEAGEYATYIILSSKNGRESYLLPAVMNKEDKVIKHGDKEKVTDFLTKIIELYGTK